MAGLYLLIILVIHLTTATMNFLGGVRSKTIFTLVICPLLLISGHLFLSALFLAYPSRRKVAQLSVYHLKVRATVSSEVVIAVILFYFHLPAQHSSSLVAPR